MFFVELQGSTAINAGKLSALENPGEGPNRLRTFKNGGKKEYATNNNI